MPNFSRKRLQVRATQVSISTVSVIRAASSDAGSSQDCQQRQVPDPCRNRLQRIGTQGPINIVSVTVPDITQRGRYSQGTQRRQLPNPTRNRLQLIETQIPIT